MHLYPSVDHLRNLYPSIRQSSLVKVIWFEILNVALCFTVQMGFKSSDSIITKGINEKFEVSGVYTLIISVVVYFVILRTILVELFHTVPLTVHRVLRRVEDATQKNIIHPVSYFIPYSHLPLNRRYESHLVLKLWSTFKIVTSIFFIVCPVLLLGYTTVAAFGILHVGVNYHYIPKWSSIMSVTTDIITSILILLGMMGLLVYFLADSASKSKSRPKGKSRQLCRANST